MLLFKIRPRGGGCPGKVTVGQLGFLQAQSLLLAGGAGRSVVPAGCGEVAVGFWEGVWVAGGEVLAAWCGLGAGVGGWCWFPCREGTVLSFRPNRSALG